MEGDAAPASVPIGRTGRLEAVALAAGEDHAVLVKDAGRPRALLSGDPGADGGTAAERLVVMPLDHDVDVRVDGDALAIWLGSQPLEPEQRQPLPAWASAIGLVLLLLLVAFAAIGSLTVMGWIVGWLA